MDTAVLYFTKEPLTDDKIVQTPSVVLLTHVVLVHPKGEDLLIWVHMAEGIHETLGEEGREVVTLFWCITRDAVALLHIVNIYVLVSNV